jgi:hypothetical protein
MHEKEKSTSIRVDSSCDHSGRTVSQAVSNGCVAIILKDQKIGMGNMVERGLSNRRGSLEAGVVIAVTRCDGRSQNLRVLAWLIDGSIHKSNRVPRYLRAVRERCMYVQ